MMRIASFGLFGLFLAFSSLHAASPPQSASFDCARASHPLEKTICASPKLRALDGEGRERLIEAEGLLAICIQHEMDHLLGKVFVEYLSPLKRNRIKTKMLKAQREAEREATR